MDFTIEKYKELLSSIQKNGYKCMTFSNFCESKPRNERIVILRHDVDLKPQNSLTIAKIEASYGIQSSFYFRTVKESYNENIIKKIANLNHEIGYHYESLTTCNGNISNAYNDFLKNLEQLRKLTSVKTICMHGSPRSEFDSKDLWKTYDYKKLEIIGEPYIDVDYNKTLYLTDTGRCWDGEKYSIRDKVNSTFTLQFRTTNDIVSAFNHGEMPNCIIITTHPQRWSDNKFEWIKELILQKCIKNPIKRILLSSREYK